MDKHKTNAMRILDKQAIAYEALAYDASDGNIDGVSVAAKIGWELCKVYKTLVLQGSDKNYYVAVIPVAEELDLKKAAKAFGVKNLALIPVADILRVTGYIRGGCSPIGMKKDFPLCIDSRVKEQDYILVSAGRIGTQLKLRPQELIALRRAETAELIRD